MSWVTCHMSCAMCHMSRNMDMGEDRENKYMPYREWLPMQVVK